MLKNKYVLLYIGVAALFGYVSDGGGLMGAIAMPLMAPGAFLNLIMSPHNVNNNSLIAGGSLIYWLALYVRFKYFSPSTAPVASQAPNTVSLQRVRTVETFED